MTSNEAKDLVEYWFTMWFWPYNFKGFSHIIYMFPQEEYDNFLPININPYPEFLNRVGLFFISDIPINSHQNNLKLTFELENTSNNISDIVKGNMSLINMGVDEANISLYSVIKVIDENQKTVFQEFININNYIYIDLFPPYSGEKLEIYWNQTNNMGNK